MTVRYTVNIDTVEASITGMKFDLSDGGKGTFTQTDGNVKSYSGYVKVPPLLGRHRLTIKSTDNERTLHVSGSFGGFLHGQNVCTSSDLKGLCLSTLKLIFKSRGWKAGAANGQRWADGDIHLHRVDLACNFELESEQEVETLIRELRWTSAGSRSEVRLYSTSVWFTPDGGADHEVLYYAKGAELRRKRSNPKGLAAACAHILRVEVRLNGALKRLGLSKASAWGKDTPEEVFRSLFSASRLPPVTSGPLTTTDVAGLPQRLKHVMAAYKAGVDLKTVYAYQTLLRHRKDLLEHGIDIRIANVPHSRQKSLLGDLSNRPTLSHQPHWLDEAVHGAGKGPRDS